MEIDIRKAIINNFKDSTEENITESIVESIKQGDEIVLPGLGVLFEILWNNSSSDEQKTIVDRLKKSLQ